MKREYIDYVEDIINSMNKMEKFIENMGYEDFVKDEKTTFAVIRALEVIGEAVKSIPEDIKKRYPEIRWKEIAGMRDKLAHEYFGIKLEVVWNAVKTEIPPLKPKFQKILENLESNKNEHK
ncbi:MAG: DUF86 domain-containing protein [Elusimicrobiota bacterium]